MLAARRDPPLHSGAHEAPHLSGTHAPHATPGLARLMTVLQVVGSLLAIPVGLASGYSIYHANFSPEANCQSLRAGIISMLDKNADATTLRLLVRRDVQAFEGSCGSVDPDAVAAFKTLLARGKTAAPAASPPVVATKEATRVTVRQPENVLTRAALKTPSALTENKPVRRDGTSSDADWVTAVRQALVHSPAPLAEASEAPLAVATTPRLPPQTRKQHELPAPAISLAPGAAAPAIPPTATVAARPAPLADDAHPVPPAPIPDAAPLRKAAEAAPATRHSGFSGLIAQIPLLGRMVGR